MARGQSRPLDLPRGFKPDCALGRALGARPKPGPRYGAASDYQLPDEVRGEIDPAKARGGVV